MVVQLNFKLVRDPTKVGLFSRQTGWVGGGHWNTFSNLFNICSV